ncbi:nucleotide disphospho-sugar-binding domain-containing protein [Nocardia wallacei]|uniref:nucleotide disphospho-sugar-binding domain-containing protein n=1 Tax=Nocardia wallacei TaxID=480035 RepID=UPI002453AF47|nr:nucleotide disphospho-sugar-binding domain-containing protein [Nocardia wallacei]
MVPLEWACQAAGHEVLVASTPSLTDVILRSGMPAVAVGKDVEMTPGPAARRRTARRAHRRWPDRWPIHPELLDETQRELVAAVGRIHIGMAEAMVDDLIEVARSWRPDLILHDALSFAGAVTASVLDVPNVSSLWGAPGPQRAEMRDFRSEPLPEYVDLYATRAAPIRNTPTAWIDPCPPAIRLPLDGRCLPVRYVPYNGPGAVPDWLFEPGPRPRVCVTWGATEAKLGAAPTDLVRGVLRATAALDVEVVLATTEQMRVELGELPVGVRVAIDLPLKYLLPGCAAVVHHGGAGTTLTAGINGVPQLIITTRPEPALIGSQWAAGGGGRHLLAAELPAEEEATVEVLGRELALVLRESSYRAGAESIRAGMLATPSPAELVGSLEQLV